ncbi:MAG: FG-GAP repeat protein [Desulfobulbaceae bacterium]|nr:FG-GAP repeat protein [Desulfobulbaceae bacterium]
MRYLWLLILSGVLFIAGLPGNSFAEDPSLVVTEYKVTASDNSGLDKFGQAVAISGQYALVGSSGDNDKGNLSGSAYVFQNNTGNWVQTQKLTASDGADLDKFGQSVALEGNYALIGAQGRDTNEETVGSVYVFTNNGGAWSQEQKLMASDGSSWDNFGHSVALSGDYVFIGAPGANDNGDSSGAVYVFLFNGSSWVEVQKLTADDGAGWDKFGQSVVVSGSNAVVGAPGDNVADVLSGSAYIFENNMGTWMQVQKLTASDGASWDKFGCSLSMSGTDILVGAFGDDDNGDSSGSAYLFTHNGSSWVQAQKLTASDGVLADYFGSSVSINKNYAFIGAYGDDDLGISSGAAYVFYNNGGSTWTEVAKLTASYGMPADYFGQTLAFSGNYALIGSYGDDDSGELSGSVAFYGDFNPGTDPGPTPDPIPADIEGGDNDVDGLDLVAFINQLNTQTNTITVDEFAGAFGQ